VLEIFHLQNDQQINMETFKILISENEELLEEQNVYIDGTFFVHTSIGEFDANEFDMEMLKKLNKPYYIPPKKELLKYQDNLYFEKNKQYRLLENFIAKNIYPNDKRRARNLSEETA